MKLYDAYEHIVKCYETIVIVYGHIVNCYGTIVICYEPLRLFMNIYDVYEHFTKLYYLCYGLLCVFKNIFYENLRKTMKHDELHATMNFYKSL